MEWRTELLDSSVAFLKNRLKSHLMMMMRRSSSSRPSAAEGGRRSFVEEEEDRRDDDAENEYEDEDDDLHLQRWWEDVITMDIAVPCHRPDIAILKRICSLTTTPTSEATIIREEEQQGTAIHHHQHSGRGGRLAESRPPRPDVRVTIVVDRETKDLDVSLVAELLKLETEWRNVRVRLNGHNMGASYTRNRALHDCHSEWILFIDDDVIPQPDLIQQYANAIARARKAGRRRRCGGHREELDEEAEGRSSNTRPPPPRPAAQHSWDDVSGFCGVSVLPYDRQNPRTSSFHISGISFFWRIAEFCDRNNLPAVPWGVTANLLLRWRKDLEFDLRFPKTGGGEDIDICIKAVAADEQQRRRRGVLLPAPSARVLHPWWGGGKSRLILWRRAFNWATGDSLLLDVHPAHTFMSFPNFWETLAAVALLDLCILLLFLLLSSLGISPLASGDLWAASWMQPPAAAGEGGRELDSSSLLRQLLGLTTAETFAAADLEDLETSCERDVVVVGNGLWLVVDCAVYHLTVSVCLLSVAEVAGGLVHVYLEKQGFEDIPPGTWAQFQAALESNFVRNASTFGQFCGHLRRGRMPFNAMWRFDWFLGLYPMSLVYERKRAALLSTFHAVGLGIAAYSVLRHAQQRILHCSTV